LVERSGTHLHSGYFKDTVREIIKHSGSLPVPFHIRNAPTGMMKYLGYGRDYKYAHDYEDVFISQTYLPETLEDQRFYFPTERGYEKKIKQRLDKWRNLEYQEKK